MAVDAILPIQGFDTGGVVIDSDPFSLGQKEWSNVRNVRFHNRAVSKISGEMMMRTLGNTDPVALTYWRQPNNLRYVYQTSNGRTYLNNATGTDTEITKNITGASAEPLAANAVYTGGLFNGGATYIVNDGTNIPQYINAIGSGIAAQELVDIPGWAFDSALFTSVTAGVLRPYRNVLVAGNLTFNAATGITFAPGTIRVSNLAARGQMPTWDPQLAAATTADEFELATNDPVLEMIPFQNSLLIYCQNSVHSIRLTGNSTLPVSATQELEGRGILASKCAIEFYGRHFVVGNDDIYLYGGGASVNSIIDGKLRDYFFDNLNADAKDNTFVVENRLEDEIWVCYPKGTSTNCNEALIYNYTHGTWTIRDLPNIRDAAFGATISNDDYSEGRLRLILMDNANNRLDIADEGTSFNGEAIDAFVEKRGYDVTPADDESSWRISYMWPIIRGSGEVDIRFRSTESPGRPVDFQSTRDRYLTTRTYDLDPDMGDYKVDADSDGRYLNMRIGTNDATSSWSLIKYSLGVTKEATT